MSANETAAREAPARRMSPELTLLGCFWSFIAVSAVVTVAFDLALPGIGFWTSFWTSRALIAFAVLAVATSAYRIWKDGALKGAATTLAERSAFCVTIIAFLIGFSQVKNVMHRLSFWVLDEPMAAFDAWLHGGVDPWVIYAVTLDYISFPMGGFYYHYLWAAIVLIGPVIVIMLDRNTARRRAFFTSVLFVWVGLGIVTAIAFYSVGPIFYGPLIGDEARFAALVEMAYANGFEQTVFPVTIDFLLDIRLSEDGRTGGGISAFPSVHLGVATLFCMYLISLTKWLAPIGVFYVIAVQAFSVLSGMHYAIDGYASIVLTAAAWTIAIRRFRRLEIDETEAV